MKPLHVAGLAVFALIALFVFLWATINVQIHPTANASLADKADQEPVGREKQSRTSNFGDVDALEQSGNGRSEAKANPGQDLKPISKTPIETPIAPRLGEKPSDEMQKLLRMGDPSRLSELNPDDFTDVPIRADYVGDAAPDKLHLHSELGPDVLRVHIDCRVGEQGSLTGTPVELSRVADSKSWRVKTDQFGLALIQIPASGWEDEYWLRLLYDGRTYSKYLSGRRTLCGERPMIHVIERSPFRGKCVVSFRVPEPDEQDLHIKVMDPGSKPAPGVGIWSGSTFLATTGGSGEATVSSALIDLSNGGYIGAYMPGWIPVFEAKGVALECAGLERTLEFKLSMRETVINVSCAAVPEDEELNQKSYTRDQRYWGDILRKPNSRPFDRYSDYGQAVLTDKSLAWQLRELGGWYAGCWRYTGNGYEVILPSEGEYVVLVGRRIEHSIRRNRNIEILVPSNLLDVSVKGGNAAVELVRVN